MMRGDSRTEHKVAAQRQIFNLNCGNRSSQDTFGKGNFNFELKITVSLLQEDPST